MNAHSPNPKQNFVFFLGGHDAEMLEIRNMLVSLGYTFYDKNLKWGAMASEYKQEINSLSSDKIPVLIELNIDIHLPQNAIVIDHHNEKSGVNQKTSIEQLAQLLGIQLNRHQKLISANDKGHIWGLKEAGATDDEIRYIRMIDRQAQGVTDEDERLAQESIDKHLKVIDKHTVIVKSLTEKTSAVIDGLVDKFQDIYVLTPAGDLNFSGRGETVMRLVREFECKKKTNPTLIFWYGGNLPERGYFGAKGDFNFEISDNGFEIFFNIR